MFNIEEFYYIKDRITNLKDFKIEKKIKNKKISIKSSVAACDFKKTNTNKGVYIVLYSCHEKDEGFGGPIVQEDFLKYFGNFRVFEEFISKLVGSEQENSKQITINDYLGG